MPDIELADLETIRRSSAAVRGDRVRQLATGEDGDGEEVPA